MGGCWPDSCSSPPGRGRSDTGSGLFGTFHPQTRGDYLLQEWNDNMYFRLKKGSDFPSVHLFSDQIPIFSTLWTKYFPLPQT